MTDAASDLAELERAARALKHVMWDRPDVRHMLARVGIHVTPANFYSVLPTPDELDASFEYAEHAPYLDERVFDAARLRAFLTEELHPYAHEFDPPVEDPGGDRPAFHWKNPAFSWSDAMAYWCVLRATKPATVLEVGSGWSTLVARAALDRNGGGRLVCVEPYPMAWLRDVPGVELHEQRVQSLDSRWFDEQLRDGDVLFIDSTHTVKTGSDCAHLYLRVLPRLRADLLVHAHDIYLPFGIPAQKVVRQHIYWNEQYVLMALLLENPRFEVVYGSAYLHAFERPALDALMHGRWRPGGASFWFRRTGAPAQQAR